MSVGIASAIMLAGGAYSAASQYSAGKQQAQNIQRQSEYNAQIYEQQAGMIMEQKKLKEYQYNREAARFRGSVIARTAGKGLNLSGSPLAILIDNETQMKYDQAIDQYNLDVSKNYALSGAEYTRQTGVQESRLARARGTAGAFSTILNSATNYAILNMTYPTARKP